MNLERVTIADYCGPVLIRTYMGDFVYVHSARVTWQSLSVYRVRPRNEIDGRGTRYDTFQQAISRIEVDLPLLQRAPSRSPFIPEVNLGKNIWVQRQAMLEF